MSANLQTIARFSDPIEAELACARLLDEGLNAVVTGHETSTLFGPYTFGGLDLLVPAEECERAEAILADLAKEIDARKNRPKEAIMAEPPPVEAEETPEEIAARPNRSEDLTQRAFRASLFGYLIVFWPIFHLYALFLLLDVTFNDEEVRGRYSARYYIAFVLSAIAVACGGIFLAYGYGLSVLAVTVGIGYVMYWFTVRRQQPNASGPDNPP